MHLGQADAEVLGSGGLRIELLRNRNMPADIRQAPPATTIQWRALPAAGVAPDAGSGAGVGVMASL